MKYVIGVFATLLLVVGVLAYLNLKGNSASKIIPQTAKSTDSVEVPMSGNPDDVVAAAERAASDEQVSVSNEDEDKSEVAGDSSDIDGVEGAVGENDF